MPKNTETPAYNENGEYAPARLLWNIFRNREYTKTCLRGIGQGDEQSRTHSNQDKHFVIFDGLGSNRSAPNMIKSLHARGNVHKAPTRRRLPLRNSAAPETTAKTAVEQVVRDIRNAIVNASHLENLEIAFVAHSLGAAIARKMILLLEERGQQDHINYLEHVKELHTYAGACGPMEIRDGIANRAVAKLAIGNQMEAQFTDQAVKAENTKLQAVCQQYGIRIICNISVNDSVIAPEHQTYGGSSEAKPHQAGHFGIWEASESDFNSILR